MQATEFLTLTEGQTFSYTDGDDVSRWVVTGALGTDCIDAKCIDPLPYDTPEEVFYISAAERMTLDAPSFYTPEHAARQAAIANWQFYARSRAPGREVVSHHVSRMTYTWAEVTGSEGPTIRFVMPGNHVHYQLRTQD